MFNDITNSLAWRYATKKYDPSKKLTKEQFDTIIESLRLAPSSTGLQPWKFIDVTSPDLRLKLKTAGFNQPQITDADHLIVLCAVELDEKYVDLYLTSVAKTRSQDVGSLAGYKGMIMSNIKGKSAEDMRNWSARQVYLALGQALLSAALLKVDATPMEGFDKAKFDEILGLKEKGLTSQVLLALGFRSEDDEMAKYKKVRFSRDEIVEVL